MKAALIMLTLLVAADAIAGEPRFRVVDRREVDGTVIVVRYVPRKTTGGKPFLSGRHWDLTPSSDFFRVREISIPARNVGKNGDPPAVTMRQGKVGANNWTNAFGGEARTFFQPGDIVRLVRLNAAFNIVRMDVEAVCRPASFGRRLRGRVDVVLSGQVNAATFDEANGAVGQVLEPVELARVMEVCDPESGQTPLVIARGMPVKAIEQRLGEPNDTEGGVVDFGVFRVATQNGVVEKIIVPSID